MGCYTEEKQRIEEESQTNRRRNQGTSCIEPDCHVKEDGTTGTKTRNGTPHWTDAGCYDAAATPMSSITTVTTITTQGTAEASASA